MPSLGSILSIARSGLSASQAGINVTSNNIANAGNAGYSRQRLALTPGPAQNFGNVVYGTGVRVADVTRVRDSYLDASFRSESSSASRDETRSGMLARIEGMLAEPADDALADTLDRFFSSFSELAADPTSNTARTLVLEQSRQVSTQFDRLANGLDGLRQESEGRLTSAVGRVNALLDNIATLNRRVVADEAAGETAGDVRDQRDRMIDELATLADVDVIERENGSVGVLLDGVAIVDGAQSAELEIRVGGGAIEVARVGVANAIPSVGGTISGLLDVVNRDLPDVRTRLDDLASSFVQEVNAIHSTGTNAAGATGLDLFDPAGLAADTIALAITDPADVAAGTADGAGDYRAGENDVARDIAALRDASLAGIGVRAGDFFTSLVSDVGSAVRFTRDSSEVHRTMAEQADTRRQEVSGVSTDEELIALIQYQSAYGAAARVISTADEMLQTLISI